MADDGETTSEWLQRMVGIDASEKARMERPRAEERARRRWGVRDTRVPQRGDRKRTVWTNGPS